MRSLLFALLIVMSAPYSALLAQESTDAAQCPVIIFESKIDRKTIVESCTQLIESGKLTGRALARAHLTRMLASWAVRTRDHSQTIAETTVMIEIDPELRFAYFIRHTSYLENGDYDRALQDATKFIELGRPTDWSALHIRSSIYAAMGDYERAVADETKAVEIAPKTATVYAKRASTYVQAGRTAEALSDLNHALSLPVRWPQHHFQRGKILEDLGRTEEAIADYREAIRLDPKNFLYQQAIGRLGAAP